MVRLRRHEDHGHRLVDAQDPGLEGDCRVSTWEHLKPAGVVPALPAPCRLDGTTSAKVANGDTFRLKVATTSNAVAGSWCLVKLTSDGTDPNGDISHPWWVGFVLQR